MIPHIGFIGLCEPPPMTSDDLRSWQKRMGFTYDTAAQALRIARMTYANYLRTGKIPHVVFLATLAIEHYDKITTK